MPNARTLITVAVCLIILGGGTYWYFSSIEKQQTAVLLKKYLQSTRIYASGDYDKSVTSLENFLKEDAPMDLLIKTKLKLAQSLFIRNEAGDKENAVSIYKEVINNTSIVPFYRANAINGFLEIYKLFRSEMPKKAIFGEPFSTIFTESGGDLNLALRKSYEYSDSIHETAIASFRIGEWYRNALYQPANIEEAKKKEYVSNLISWTEKGEKSLLVGGVDDYSKNTLGQIYQINALNRWVIANFSDKNYDLTEKLFKQSLMALEPEKDFQLISVSLYVRFYYASMIAGIYEDERQNDIKSLLDPIINRPAWLAEEPLFFDDFLKNEATQNISSPGHKKDLALLAKLYPDFGKFLRAQNIKY